MWDKCFCRCWRSVRALWDPSYNVGSSRAVKRPPQTSVFIPASLTYAKQWLDSFDHMINVEILKSLAEREGLFSPLQMSSVAAMEMIYSLALFSCLSLSSYRFCNLPMKRIKSHWVTSATLHWATHTLMSHESSLTSQCVAWYSSFHATLRSVPNTFTVVPLRINSALGDVQWLCL